MWLDDRHGFAAGRIEEVAERAGVNGRRILVIAGLHHLTGSDAGATISRMLWDERITRADVPLEEHRAKDWEAAVMLTERVCAREGFPSYFSYLVAHELGHAKIIVDDLALHCSNCLLEQALAWIDRELPVHLLPHEERLDQFGLAVAGQLHGSETLRRELQGLLADEGRQDRDRLRHMLDLEPRLDLEGLREQVMSFTAPCAAAIRRWTQIREGKIQGARRRSLFDFADQPLLWMT